MVLPSLYMENAWKLPTSIHLQKWLWMEFQVVVSTFTAKHLCFPPEYVFCLMKGKNEFKKDFETHLYIKHHYFYIQ